MAAVELVQACAGNVGGKLPPVCDRHDPILPSVDDEQRPSIRAQRLTVVEGIADQERGQQETCGEVGDAGKRGFENQSGDLAIHREARRGAAAERSAVGDDTTGVDPRIAAAQSNAACTASVIDFSDGAPGARP